MATWASTSSSRVVNCVGAAGAFPPSAPASRSASVRSSCPGACRDGGVGGQPPQLGVHLADLLLGGPALADTGGMRLAQSQSAVHLVAHRELEAQPVRRGDHQVGGPIADRCARPVGAVQHRPRGAVHHDGHREDGLDALGEHGCVVVVRDVGGVAVVGHRHRPSRHHAGAAEARARPDHQPAQQPGPGSDELAEQQRVAVHLAAEQHRDTALGGDVAQLGPQRVRVTRAQQRRTGGHADPLFRG